MACMRHAVNAPLSGYGHSLATLAQIALCRALQPAVGQQAKRDKDGKEQQHDPSLVEHRTWQGQRVEAYGEEDLQREVGEVGCVADVPSQPQCRASPCQRKPRAASAATSSG